MKKLLKGFDTYLYVHQSEVEHEEIVKGFGAYLYVNQSEVEEIVKRFILTYMLTRVKLKTYME